MREVQGFPEDFDGALTGAREHIFRLSQDAYTHLTILQLHNGSQDSKLQYLTFAPLGILTLFENRNGFNIYAGQLNMNDSTPGEVVPTSFFPTWAQEVIAQCDEIDGVKDNIILNVSRS